MEHKVNFPDVKHLANSEDLSYFIAMQESKPADVLNHSTKKWDQRAEAWKREQNQKGDSRVDGVLNYLEEQGMLQCEFDVVDIGCGPGRFVAEFAKRVHRVVGLDISEKMVAHGMEHIQSEGLTNVVLRTCDFQTLDLEQEGYRRAFDLVFSSLTPAIHGMNGLMKSMEMSRGWCCNITHLNGRNLLREQIVQDLFGRTPLCQWTGRWFYSLFNVLFLLGYHPETSYENRRKEIWIHPDEEYAEFMMEHMLPAEEMTKENAERILNWLKKHQNEDGLVREISDSAYGRILWDVRNRVDRPDYRDQMV